MGACKINYISVQNKFEKPRSAEFFIDLTRSLSCGFSVERSARDNKNCLFSASLNVSTANDNNNWNTLNSWFGYLHVKR